MRVRYKFIDGLVDQLRWDHDYLQTPAVDVVRLTVDLGIDYNESDYGDTLSGCAIIRDGNRLISVNSAHSEHRKRFTTAHEIGHILLHADQPISVDVKPITFLRDRSSSTGEAWREVEANYFAASVLMPRTALESEISLIRETSWDDDELIKQLVKTFNVSAQAIGIRLSSLGITLF